MKKMKTLVTAVVLYCGSWLGMSTANALPILTYVYAFDSLVLSVELYLDDSLVNSGIGEISIADNIGFDVVSADIPITSLSYIFWDFDAYIDVDNVNKGVTYLYADAEAAPYYTFSYLIDVLSPTDNWFTIYDVQSNDYDNFALANDVTISSIVSEPSMLITLALGFAGLVYRRRPT